MQDTTVLLNYVENLRGTHNQEKPYYNEFLEYVMLVWIKNGRSTKLTKLTNLMHGKIVQI